MTNDCISSGDKLFSRGVPFHAVDFTSDPLDVCGIAAKFGEFRNRQDMVQRIVQAQNYFFARVGAAVILIMKFLADKLCVLCGFQAVRGSLLEITMLAKAILLPGHRRQRGILTANIANAKSCIFLSELLVILGATLPAAYAVNQSGASGLRTENAKTLRFQSVVSFASTFTASSATFWRLSVTFVRFAILLVVSSVLVHWTMIAQNPVNVSGMEA